MTWQLTRVTQKTRVHESSPRGEPITMCIMHILLSWVEFHRKMVFTRTFILVLKSNRQQHEV